MKSPRRIDYWLLWVVALLSFTANALLIRLLIDARQQASKGFDLAVNALGAVHDGHVSYTAHIEQNVPVSLTIPVDTTITVNGKETPLKTELPVSTTVPLSFDLPIQMPIADTPVGEPLVKAQDYLKELSAAWKADPLQVFFSPPKP
jgi:hypothetical protein